ncbi:hypothetical protein DEU56DRAFT_754289 [Suillus clintonianus]|uniref:uncharacterized protein n=1 Tax=Suillus clintonianus TaxID=1904413 RepID=UPI001B876576|nr:uncharacterized protein DEU56DRAFT_754289 [Suillus clintonianus]KAG2144220.1 hypothetical protein DEU56DRAFT_754289 [Suillus clintonianus]
MHMDDIISPQKYEFSLPAASSSNFGSVSSSTALATSHPIFREDTSVNMCAPFYSALNNSTRSPTAGDAPATQLPNSRFPLSQSLHHHTITGQKQVTLPPFKPPLLKKPNPKYVLAPKQVVQTPESPPTSTPELDKDDSNVDGDVEDTGGAAGVDSSFDVSFDVDADALEATMRQYD